MQRRLAIVAVAALVVAGLSPTASQAASACPNAFPASFVSALEHDYPGLRITAAVYDTRSGCWSHIHQGMQITTASVIKAQILGAVLLRAQQAHRGLTSWERSQIVPMIRYSSNDETSALYDHVGGTSGMHATDSAFGATATTHVRPFGLTRSTAVDRAQVALRLLQGGGGLSQAGRDQAWDFMTGVHPLQQWGITAGVPEGWTTALKNGFYPASGLGWRVGSAGFVRSNDARQGYAIAVMTEEASTQATGIAAVERVSRQAAATLTIGPAAPRAVARARCTTTSSGESWTTVTARLGLPSSRAGEVRLTSGNNPSPLSGQRACSPDIPAEPRSASSAINGRYRTAVTDLNCDHRDDLIWYSPTGTDSVWHGGNDRRFDNTTISVAGDRIPIGGDFDGDGCGDLLWYGPGIVPDALWWGGATVKQGTLSPINGLGYIARAGDFDGDGRTDLLWYAPGSAADAIWYGRGDRRFDNRSISVNGAYQPVIGDVDANGTDDIVWYGPGGAADSLWRNTRARTNPSEPLTVNGRYRPVILADRGTGPDSLFWYGPGSLPDFLRTGIPSIDDRSVVVNGDYLPLAGDFDGDGHDDIAWYGPGGASDFVGWGAASGSFTSTTLQRG